MSNDKDQDACNRLAFQITKTEKASFGMDYPSQGQAVIYNAMKGESSKATFMDNDEYNGWQIKMGNAPPADYKVVIYDEDDDIICPLSCDGDDVGHMFCLATSESGLKALEKMIKAKTMNWTFKNNKMPVVTYSGSCLQSGVLNDPKYPGDISDSGYDFPVNDDQMTDDSIKGMDGGDGKGGDKGMDSGDDMGGMGGKKPDGEKDKKTNGNDDEMDIKKDAGKKKKNDDMNDGKSDKKPDEEKDKKKNGNDDKMDDTMDDGKKMKNDMNDGKKKKNDEDMNNEKTKKTGDENKKTKGNKGGDNDE